MSHPIPTDAGRLIVRARELAEEMASAARYGIPIPAHVSLSNHQFGRTSWHCLDDRRLFDAWVEYTDATVREYDHDGKHVSTATADCNGLLIEFSMHAPIAALAVVQ